MVLGIAPVAIIDRQLPFEYTITSRSTDVVVMALPVQNINHSAFRSMFEREKLSGNNFNDWFRQLKLVSRVEKEMYVIEQPLPDVPTVDSEAQVLSQWNAVYDAYNEVACLIIGSMTPELHRQFENSSPYDMIKELKSIFEKQAGVEMFDLIQTFHACKQEEGKPVTAYVLQMKGYVDQLERLGYMLPQDLIVGGKIQKANKKSLKAKGKGKANSKGKDKQVYIPKPKNPKPSAKEHPAKDDTCHHCKEVGHWKRNFLSILLSYNCHYASSITRGVVSVHRLAENGFAQCFTDFGILVSKNNVFYFNAIPSNGIYEIDMHDLVSNVNSIYNVRTKRAKHNLDSTYQWHCRLTHISKKRIERLQQEGLLKSTDDESFDQCVSCLSGKMTRKSFPHHTERATDLLGYILMCVVHLDMCQDKETMGYYFYFPPEKKIVVARYVEFFEKNLITQEVSGRVMDLEEIQDEDTLPSEITSEIPMEVESFELPQEEVFPVRRYERTHRAPDHLCLNVEAEEHSLEDLNEPTSYKAVMLDSESNK
ncbi:retrotransposon protein, putative, ty1-copia subclass [Tanacetum coccineum]